MSSNPSTPSPSSPSPPLGPSPADTSAAASAAPPRGLLKNGDIRLRACRHGVMVYSIKDIYAGRSLETYGEYCEIAGELYRQILTPGQIVVEAGANIGCDTLRFARAVGPKGQVHAFEPQRRIFHMLAANVALNDLTNVHCQPGALGQADGKITVPPLDYGLPANFGEIALTADGEPGERVALNRIDSLGLARCDLLRVSVNGMEHEVLMGAEATIRRDEPLILVDGSKREAAPALIRFLLERGYRLFWHLPRLFNPNNHFRAATNLFGNAARIDILCLPSDDRRNVEVLKPITAPEDWWIGP